MIVAAGGVEHSSLVGCIKDIRVNRKPLGIKESSASRGISASKDCIWKFVCLLEDPCIESAECYQNGFDGFHCVCDENDCTRANYSSYLSSSKSRSNSVSFSTSREEDERRVKQTEYTDHHSKSKKLKKQDRVSSPSPPSSSTSSSVTSTAISSGRQVTLGKEYTSTSSIEERKTLTDSSISPNEQDTLENENKNNPEKAKERKDTANQRVTLQEVQQSLPPHPLNYLSQFLTKEELTISIVVGVILFAIMISIVVIRECYLFGRRQEGRKRSRQLSRKEINDVDERNRGGGVNSGLGSDNFLGLPSSSSPMTSVLDVDTGSQSGDLLMMSSASLSGAPSTPLYAESIDSRQQPVLHQLHHHHHLQQRSSRHHPSPLYSRVDKRTSPHPTLHERRESTLICPPLPPLPSLYFSTGSNALSSSSETATAATVFSQERSLLHQQHLTSRESHGPSSSSGCESEGTTAGDLQSRSLFDDQRREEEEEEEDETRDEERGVRGGRNESRCFMFDPQQKQSLLLTTFSHPSSPRRRQYDPYSVMQTSSSQASQVYPGQEQETGIMMMIPSGFSTVGRRGSRAGTTYGSTSGNNTRFKQSLDFSASLQPSNTRQFMEGNQSEYFEHYSRPRVSHNNSSCCEGDALPLPSPPPQDFLHPVDEASGGDCPLLPSLKRVPWSCEDITSIHDIHPSLRRN